MERKFIIDKEINLNDYDYLRTKIYADNLTKIIDNTDKDKVFTIGLFGNWGTGKSSIIETSKNDFDQEKIKFITYDAWQYVNDSFRRMFLKKIREDLNYEETELLKKFYVNESTDVGNKYRLSSKRLSFILIGLIFLLAIITFIPFDFDYKFPVYSILTLLGFLITIISGAFHQLKISVTKPHLFAPEQFESCFKEMISNSLKKQNVLLKWVKGDKSKQNLEKIIIVIDNIDRCSNDIAYNLLTDIKTFLSSNSYSIVFIIPVDDEALRKHIINSNSNVENSDKDKEEFLRKFFNVTIRIKPYDETDMFSFAKQISEKYQLDFKPETINIASKEYAKNPRRVIQLFNNLLAELNYYDQEFIQRNETLVCSILIIREEYPDYYKQLVNSPKLFFDSKTDEQKDKNEELERFIRIAQNAIRNVEIADINKILTNSYNQFDDIDSDIKDSIITFDIKKILTRWESEKEKMIDFIVDKLINAIKNQLIDTELVSYFDIVTEINKQYPLDNHLAKRIDEKITPHLSIIISRTKNHENLCNYAYSRDKQENKKIKEALINNCNNKSALQEKEHWQSLFTAVLKVFNDKNTSIELSSIYTKYSQDIAYNNFSPEQFEWLISNEFVKQNITKLPMKDGNNEIIFDTNSTEYQKVKWLFENKHNIDESTYDHLFIHIIGENNDTSKMKGKTVDNIIDILKFVNPLIVLIPDSKLTTEPQILYNLIVNDKQVVKQQYANNHTILNNSQYFNSQYYNKVNFIDECISSNKYIQEIIDFVINIYRITNNNTSVDREIGKLINHTSLDKRFIELINKGYTLIPILDLVFDYKSENNFEDNDRLILLQHCFKQKSENKYQITEDKAKNKIDELLNFAQSQKSEKVYIFLESLIVQERYKVLLTDLIIEKDCDFINSLPQKFLKLAVGTFKKENFNDYANNFNFLKVIVQHGNDIQKGYVVNILTTKLDNNENIDQILDIIDTMRNIPSFDQSGLLHSHLDKYLRDNKEILSEELKNKLEKQIEKTGKGKK